MLTIIYLFLIMKKTGMQLIDNIAKQKEEDKLLFRIHHESADTCPEPLVVFHYSLK